MIKKLEGLKKVITDITMISYNKIKKHHLVLIIHIIKKKCLNVNFKANLFRIDKIKLCLSNKR